MTEAKGEIKKCVEESKKDKYQIKQIRNNLSDQETFRWLRSLTSSYDSKLKGEPALLIGSRAAEQLLGAKEVSEHSDTDLIASRLWTMDLLTAITPDDHGVTVTTYVPKDQKEPIRAKVFYRSVPLGVELKIKLTLDVEVCVSQGSFDAILMSESHVSELVPDLKVRVAPLPVLEAIKTAHIIWPPRFDDSDPERNLRHLHLMRDELYGGPLNPETNTRPKSKMGRSGQLESLMKLRRAEHLMAFGGDPAAHISMKDKMNDDFLDKTYLPGVQRVVKHDSIHEAVKMGARPIHELIRRDPLRPKCDWDLFEALTPALRRACFQEEAMVIALERFLTQRSNTLTPEQAYQIALFKVLSTLFKNQWRDYAIDIWPLIRTCPRTAEEMMAIAKALVDEHVAASRRGKPKHKKDDSKEKKKTRVHKETHELMQGRGFLQAFYRLMDVYGCNSEEDQAEAKKLFLSKKSPLHQLPSSSWHKTTAYQVDDLYFYVRSRHSGPDGGGCTSRESFEFDIWYTTEHEMLDEKKGDDDGVAAEQAAKQLRRRLDHGGDCDRWGYKTGIDGLQNLLNLEYSITRGRYSSNSDMVEEGGIHASGMSPESVDTRVKVAFMMLAEGFNLTWDVGQHKMQMENEFEQATNEIWQMWNRL